MSPPKSNEEKLLYLENHIKSYPNFPKPGILFRDIFSALAHGPVCKVLMELMVEHINLNFPGVEAIVGLEARGFLFAFALAAKLGVGCHVVRKKGKLPGNTKSIVYTLEYGTDEFEIQTDTLKKGIKCLLVDDLLATGGSLRAAAGLLKSSQCDIVGCLVVIELLPLCGRNNLPDDVPVHSLVKYNDS